MSRGVEARGSHWTPGVPRALGWGRAANETGKTGLPGASIKNTGDGAWAWRTFLRDLLRSRQGHTGNTCDHPATVLEHLSHTVRLHRRRRDSAIPFKHIEARKAG